MKMISHIATEHEFYATVKAECDKRGYSDKQRHFVEMTCAENGYDCGEQIWTVAINTLAMYIDQNELDAVAANQR
jgi:hypothetical protein